MLVVQVTMMLVEMGEVVVVIVEVTKTMQADLNAVVTKANPRVSGFMRFFMTEVMEVETVVLTALAPGWSVLGQKLHHILDSPQLLLDLNVTLARWLRLVGRHTHTHTSVNRHIHTHRPLCPQASVQSSSSIIGQFFLVYAFTTE